MHYLASYLILYGVASTFQSEIQKSTKKPRLYERAQVWRSALRTISDITVIKELMNAQDLSVWHLSPAEAIFLVHPERKLKVHRQLLTRGLNHSVLIMDVQHRIDEHRIKPPSWDKKALRRGHRMDWNRYPTIEVIDEYFNYLVKQYPSLCKLEVIGRSVENRTIKMLTLSNGNPKNKGIMVLSGQHAREWSAITSSLIILREIVTKFDSLATYMQEKDWYIIPLTNPDGYLYTYTHDRLWRKNRRRMRNCYGIDLNRNFGKNFNVPGITDLNECQDSYSGPGPFSEPESIALRKITLKLKHKLIAMVDLHMFGQFILFPWSSIPDKSPDFDLHNRTTAGMNKAIEKFQQRRYRYGPTYHLIYPASGSLLDWMYFMGIRHSYVIEGRDGVHGFLVPPHFIQEHGQEMFAAVKYLASVITTKGNGSDANNWL